MRRLSLAAIALLVAACSESAPQPPPPRADPQPVATNTGAFAVVAVGGTLKAYTPGGTGPDGHNRLWVVDAAATRNGYSGSLGSVDLGPDGDAEAVAATSGLVVAVSFNTPYLWFIDPATDKVTTQLQLPDSYGLINLSERTGFMAGVALDPLRRRGYVSVWSGFKILDLDTQAFLGDILVAPSENFAFDLAKNRLVAPFYLCPPQDGGSGPPAPCDTYRSPFPTPDGTLITQGLNVVDLDSGEIFTYVDPGAADQSMPIGFQPDSAAMDPTGQLVLVAAEDPAAVQVLDLATAAFDRATWTFTASRLSLDTLPLMTGLAVEAVSRLAIITEERGPNISFIDLAATTSSGAAPHASMPPLPWGAGPWAGHGDPHAVLAGVLNGKPVAWILSGHPHDWLARIDLQKLQQVPLTSTGDLDRAGVAEAVTYVFAPPAP
jgi:hypothetical protein